MSVKDNNFKSFVVTFHSLVRNHDVIIVKIALTKNKRPFTSQSFHIFKTLNFSYINYQDPVVRKQINLIQD